MPLLLENTELVWVDQPGQLLQIAKELASEKIIAVDTESNSLYAYKEQVCLVQFSSPTKDYLVDTLALQDLSPLANIFSSDHILKVFHAAEYDLICLFRDYGFKFSNLFDTMIAARVLGYDGVGLGALIEKFFNIKINKKYQRANWGQRPLKPDMLEYARQDSHYLISIQKRLRTELERKERLELAYEDFIRLTQGIEDTTESCEDDFWKLHGARELSPEKAAVLKSLYEYRESLAEAQDRPPFKVMSHQALIEIAETCPTRCTDLYKLSALHENQAKRYGRGLLEAIREGKQSPPEYPPNNHTRPCNSTLERMEELQEWRKHTAQKMGVPSDVILPREIICRVAKANPGSMSELQVKMWDVPYRFIHFGDEILSIIKQVN